MTAPRVSRVLERLEGVERDGDGSWQALCPAHDDADPSLSVSEGRDGRVLLHCHAGCEYGDVVESMGLEPRDLAPPKRGAGGGGLGEEVATYTYTDEDGEPLYEVVRFHPKTFRQRKPDGSWGVKGIRRVLYRLPEVVAARAAGEPVLIVEGEKDADRLAALGLTATTCPGGAGKWRREYTRELARARVVILPDHDDAGREHARHVAHELHGIGVLVSVLDLPDLPEKGDVSDWLDAGWDAAVLRKMAEEAPVWEPEDAPVVVAVGVGAEEEEDARTLTDTGNSARLVALHGDRMRYVPPWDKWLWWGSHAGRWLRDHQNVHIREAAKDVGRALKIEATREPDSSRAKALFKFGISSQSAPRIGAMVNLARGIDGIPLDHELLDADGWLLGVENGTIDLRTGELRPADPADLMSRQCPVEYDPEAEAPRWAQALEEWFPDPEVRAYVQRVAGAALVGLQRDHVFIIHYGTGANGKGTFIRAVEHVLGPYAVEAHLSLLVETRHTEHDTVKADLFRARLAVASETERRVRLAEASIKNLTGADRIRARHLYEDYWSFDPTHSLWLLTNHLPEIGGRDTGIWRRIRVVEWETAFMGDAADTELDAKLAAEAPGVLRWLVKGCLAWQEHGLDEPEAVVRATLEYRRREDTLGRFAEDSGLAFEPDLEIQAGELQELLDGWARDEGVTSPRQEIGTWLREHDCRRTTRRVTVEGEKKRRRVWIGVGFPFQHPGKLKRG